MHTRGVWPEGVGKVTFSCPVVRKMKPVLLVDEGRVKRVRGVAYPSNCCTMCQSNVNKSKLLNMIGWAWLLT